MRWYWIDRFTEFVSGQYAVAIKNVSLAEEQLQDYFSSYPVMPNSLIVEGIAQTGGTLVAEATEFRSPLVLAKLAKVEFHFAARPGDTLRYHAKIEQQNQDGALIVGTSHVGDRLQAETEFYLAVLGAKHGDHRLFDPRDFGRMLRILRVYEVGRSASGQPLQMPEHILLSERLGSAPT